VNKLVIDKEDLKHNIEQIKKSINKKGKNDNGEPVKIIAIVKGNAYGMGIVEYTKLLIDNGISFFGVATIEEALELRSAGIKEEILMLSSTAIEEELELLIKNNIIITIGSKEDIEVVEKIATKNKEKIKAHLKIDTGFGRYGFCYDKQEEMLVTLKEIKNIQIEGTFSHFSTSYYDDKYTKKQFEQFINTIETLKMNEIETGMLHICNSSAFLKFPEMYLNAVRIGSAFLGRVSVKNTIGLKKIGYLESKVTQIKKVSKGFNIGYSNTYKTKKETTIAVIPVGYMNGINITNGNDIFRCVDKIRRLVGSIKALFKKQEIYVNIANKKCKVLGRIGTYHITCDITDKEIKIGDKVIFQINSKFIDSGLRREYK